MPPIGTQRHHRARRASALLSGVLTLVAAAPRAGAADKKQECATAYEQSQELRATSRLRAARDALVLCARDSCPQFVQNDCIQWLTELQREIPTVVIAATDASGSDVAGVSITVDGQPFVVEHEGKPTAIDPGRHQFHFELEGFPPIDREIVIRQSEKDRIIEVSFQNGDAPTPTRDVAPTPTGADVDASERDAGPGPLRPYAYVAGGIGAAGMIGFAVLGLLGQSQRKEIEDSGCKPNCSQAEVDQVKTKLILADVSLGVGVAGLGTGLALWFLSQPSKPSSDEARSRVFFDVNVGRNAGYATVSGAF